MDDNWMTLLQNSGQLAKVIETNRYTQQFGLVLSEQDAQMILDERKNALHTQERVEFDGGIVTKIIYEFCDSDYIDQNNYVTSIIRLQDIFYLYKNEMMDEITDDELLHLMKDMYEIVCFGDLDYLENTCLANFSQAVRAGYDGFSASDGRGEYFKFDQQKRWGYKLYLQTLKELCWR